MTRDRTDFQKLILGVLEVFFVNVLIAIGSFLLSGIGNGVLILGAMAIGLSQLFYIIPRIIVLYRHRNWGTMKGIIVGAVITALLNGGCWLWLISIFR